ncbi:hypothetical protein AB0N05_37545 [Nocardia sp. NPDC051030]|uniref:hypothetical protein n=1 Tax=Nocardia sp. NPDC051030 TaxID=3155162 RepID=UPI0034192427
MLNIELSEWLPPEPVPQTRATHTWVAPWTPEVITALESRAHDARWDTQILDPHLDNGRCDVDDLLIHFHAVLTDRYDRALMLGQPLTVDRPVLLVLGALPRITPVLHRLTVLACHGGLAGIHLAVDLELATSLPSTITRHITGLFQTDYIAPVARWRAGPHGAQR